MSNRWDKTEKPTPKRRKDARKKGQIPRSREISFAAGFLTLLAFFAFGSQYMSGSFQSLFLLFGDDLHPQEVTPLTAQNWVVNLLMGVIKLAGLPVFLTVLASVSATFLQGGAVFTGESLKFKADKINPVKNLGKVFSKRGLMELAKACALVSVVIYLAASVVLGYIPYFQTMVVMDLASILSVWFEIVFQVAIRVGIFLAIVAVADYAFQRYSHEQRLKQSKQEVKEDLKDTEGQPLVKSRMRRLQRETARRRMVAAVREADVVITNPTHFAVALKYELNEMAAPTVITKGQNYLAQKIREAAEKHRIPVVQDAPLARSLYHTVEVGTEVPTDLYRAVAEVLAYVYKLKQERYR